MRTSENIAAEELELLELKYQADLLKTALTTAIDDWVEAGRTERAFEKLAIAFDSWKLANWRYNRAFDRSWELITQENIDNGQ